MGVLRLVGLSVPFSRELLKRTSYKFPSPLSAGTVSSSLTSTHTHHHLLLLLLLLLLLRRRRRRRLLLLLLLLSSSVRLAGQRLKQDESSLIFVLFWFVFAFQAKEAGQVAAEDCDCGASVVVTCLPRQKTRHPLSILSKRLKPIGPLQATLRCNYGQRSGQSAGRGVS